MQKIAHVNFAKSFRGGERQTLILIEELSRKGYQQTIVVRKNSELSLRLKHIKNLDIIPITKPYMIHLSKIKSISLLHAHETKGAHFCFFAKKLYNIPYIITRRVAKPVKNTVVNKILYKNASMTVALSSVIRDTLLELNDTINLAIIPDSFHKLCDDDACQKKSFKNNFLIGHIGELDNDDKGQEYLIEAMKLLEERYPDMHLVLLGKGKDESKFKKQAEALNNITFAGFVDDVEAYIHCFDLFVFPSLREGLGSTLLDVMQGKVPIIASNVGGIPDIIKDQRNGVLIESKSSDAIYQAILELYHDREFSMKLSNRAKVDVLQYSPKIISEKYNDIYRSII